VISSRHAGIRVDFGGNQMTQKWIAPFLFCWMGACTAAHAQTKDSYAHGELLYATHCITCHSSQIHWRDKKVVKDWGSLKAQVGRWQSAAGLGWSEEDVTDVARYLNTLHYRFPAPDMGRSSTGNAIKLTHQQ
jgi:mono/diheme cytochrome c family protein